MTSKYRSTAAQIVAIRKIAGTSSTSAYYLRDAVGSTTLLWLTVTVSSYVHSLGKLTNQLDTGAILQGIRRHTNEILQAVANSQIAPDIGQMFVGSIKSMIDIEEYTDLKDRIEKLEKALSGES